MGTQIFMLNSCLPDNLSSCSHAKKNNFTTHFLRERDNEELPTGATLTVDWENPRNIITISQRISISQPPSIIVPPKAKGLQGIEKAFEEASSLSVDLGDMNTQPSDSSKLPGPDIITLDGGSLDPLQALPKPRPLLARDGFHGERGIGG